MPQQKPLASTTIINASILVDDCYKIMDSNAQYDMKPHPIAGTPFKFVRAFTEGQLDPFNRDFGAVYLNEETKEAIYVARGTYEGGPRTVQNDWDYNFKALPFKDKSMARINDAAINVATMKAMYPNYTFSVAGHSLGAYVAQGIARKMDLYGVGFNGPSLEDVASGKFLMLSNYNDLVGRLSFAARDVVYVKKKEPQPIVWQDKGDVLSSVVDLVGQVFNLIGGLFEDNIPSKDAFHSVQKNVLEKIGDIKDVDFTKIHDPSPDNTERNKLIDGIKQLPEATLLLDAQPICGPAPTPFVFPKPSIIYLKSDQDMGNDTSGFGVQFTLPIEIPVDGIGNLFRNKIQFNEGSQQEIFTTVDGQRLCGIDNEGKPSLYSDENNDPEPSPNSDSPSEPVANEKNGVDAAFRTQSLPQKSTNMPLAINKEKQKLYMEQQPLRQSIKALHHTAIVPPLELKDPSGAEDMGGALGLLIKTIHPSADFYEKATEVSGLRQIDYLSCLYGQWLQKGELAQAGDLVFVQSTFIKDTQAWGVMIEQKDEFNMDVMLANGPTVGIGWPTAYLCTGLPMTVLKAFRPSLKPVINENSPEGKFWGPLMSYLKLVLEKKDFENPDTFISKLLKPKGIKLASVDEFKNVFSTALQPVKDLLTIPFGSIVFSESNLGVGIMLSDYSIFGSLNENKGDFKLSDRHSLEDFKPTFYWLPVCGE